MSMHKIPLTPLELDGLLAHGLDVGTPSQLSDVFRQGVAWASQHYDEAKASQDALIREIDAIISAQPAEQASLCDLVAPIRQLKATCDRYLAELRRVNDLCLSELGMGLVDARVFPIGEVIEQWRKRIEACAEVTTAADLRAAGIDLPPEIPDDAAMWPVAIQDGNFTVTPTSTEEDIKNGVLTMDITFDFAKFKTKS